MEWIKLKDNIVINFVTSESNPEPETNEWIDATGLGEVHMGAHYDGTQLTFNTLDAEYVKARKERDTLLAESDWTQLADSQLSEAEAISWASYRQALRDVPTTWGQEVEGHFVYPTKPA
jgi:hypothetical protein